MPSDEVFITIELNGRTITIAAEPPRSNVPIEPLHLGILNCDNEHCGRGMIVDMDAAATTKRFHSPQCRADRHNADAKEKS